MTVAFTDGPVTVHQGDVRECLRELADESVQCVVTSPPYWGLRDYGVAGQLGLEATPDEYVANMVAVFREVRRVMRKDATLWLNLGDSYASSPPGNTKTGVEKWATSGLHGAVSANYAKTLDASVSMKRNTVAGGLKPKDLCGIPWRVAFALQADGWYLRSDIIWAKPNPMPESVTDRPTKAHEYLFLLTKSPRYYYDADAIRESASTTSPDKLTFGEARPDVGFAGHMPDRRRYKNADKPAQDGHRRLVERVAAARRHGRAHDNPFGSGDRNTRTVWTIATQPYPDAHFATYPEDLVIPCIKAGSREGDTVLDPFAGSGTTLAVARRLGRRAVGIELNPEYVALIAKRVAGSALPLLEAIEASA